MLQSVAHVAALCNNHSAQNGRINVVDGQKGLAVWPALWRPTALRQKRSFPEARLTSNVTANSARTPEPFQIVFAISVVSDRHMADAPSDGYIGPRPFKFEQCGFGEIIATCPMLAGDADPALMGFTGSRA
jgi:hypothetical protein